MGKLRCFIASSGEEKGLEAARYIQELLDRDADITPWDQGIFNINKTNIESLIKALKEHDIAIFVLTPDDLVRIRGKKAAVPRDNVLFELGLFIGRFGRKRCFIVTPEEDNSPLIELPTDLLGIKTGTYRSNHSNRKAALGSVCNQIRNEMKQLGARPRGISRGLPYHRFAPNSFAKELHSCQELVVVGITNDQIARGLDKELSVTNKDRVLTKLKTLDVFYLVPDLWGAMPDWENMICPEGTVPGSQSRSLQILKEEHDNSMSLIDKIRNFKNKINIKKYYYNIFPMAAILAGDYSDREKGYIQVTHYVWGEECGLLPNTAPQPKGASQYLRSLRRQPR